MQKAGIVGLPNVGKSTLFNALIKSHHAEVQNYPFCTISPNVGIVKLEDERLDKIAKIIKVGKIIHAVFEFVDIAGLVKGASKGEGLGNQFLSHIREVDAIVHVVRCFNDPNINHVEKEIDPARDIEIVNSELLLSDLQSIEKKIDNVSKSAKSGDKVLKRQLEILEKIKDTLNKGEPSRKLLNKEIEKEDLPFYLSLFLLTEKPVIYAANVSENDLVNPDSNQLLSSLKEYLKKSNSIYVPVSAKLAEELIDLSKEERKEFLSGFGVQDSGTSKLIRETFNLLGLQTFFTTTGEKEVRAWTIKKGTSAIKAAGMIHTDFEKGFIKAEVIKHEDLVKLGSKHAVREAGLAKLEGKDYTINDGDIIEFKFSV